MFDTDILCFKIIAYPYERLEKDKAVGLNLSNLSLWRSLMLTHSKVLLVVDLQVGLYNAVRDFDPVTYKESIIGHAAIGQLFDLPVILTTSAEQGKIISFHTKVQI